VHLPVAQAGHELCQDEATGRVVIQAIGHNEDTRGAFAEEPVDEDVVQSRDGGADVDESFNKSLGYELDPGRCAEDMTTVGQAQTKNVIEVMAGFENSHKRMGETCIALGLL
jgi:hypothetical protein